jgi:predicted permease
VNVVDALKQGGRSGSAGPRSQRVRDALVVIEVAMSLMLLAGASLLVQSILRLERQSLGIRQDHLMRAHFFLPPVRYPDPAAITRFSDEFGNRVRALPGVMGASVTTVYPPNNGWHQMLDIPGHPATRIQDVPTANFGLSDSHYLQTMGIPLLRGRDFAESDTATSLPVALITQELQRRYFPGEDPLGRRIHIGPPTFTGIPADSGILDSADVTIVGVMGDIRNSGLASPPEPAILVLYSQNPKVNYGFKDIVIRTSANPFAMAPEISRQLHALDAEMPLAQVQTMDELVERQTGSQRFATMLLMSFAALGLLLSAVGIYGVMAYLVRQRTQEIGIRVALGAQRADILRLVLGRGGRLAITGVGIGVIAALALSRLLTAELFGISASDPLTYAGVSAVLVIVALAACYFPARRAMRVDPLVALHYE